MKKSIIISVILLLLVVSLNAKGKDRPEWVDNPKSEYPDAMFLTVIGEGDSRRDAESDATGKMAKIFESKINATSAYSERYQELITDVSTESSSDTSFENAVLVESNQTLFNLQFGESFADDTGRVFVIAYLNRMETAEIYEGKIEANNEKVVYFINQSTKSTDKLTKYANLSAANIISTNNSILVEQLAIISPTTKEMLDIPYDINKLISDYTSAAKAISFSISVKNDTDSKVKKLIESLLTDLGFSLQDNPSLYMLGEVSLERLEMPSSDKFIRWYLNLKMTDNNDTLMFSMNEKGREAHVSYVEAEARCLRTIQQEIEVKFKNKLLDYFDSMVIKK